MSTTWMISSLESVRTITSSTSNLTLRKESFWSAVVMDSFVNNTMDASISHSDSPVTFDESAPMIKVATIHSLTFESKLSRTTNQFLGIILAPHTWVPFQKLNFRQRNFSWTTTKPSTPKGRVKRMLLENKIQCKSTRMRSRNDA